MFLELLQKLGRALEAGGIPYMIIGGQAVLVYGEARLTKDIDITLGVFLDRLTEVLSLVTALGLKVLVDPEDFTRRTLVLPCQDPLTGIRVDFIFSWSEYEQQALKRRRGLFLGEQIVYFASLEDVLIHKVIAGRPRDLEDVRRLLQKNPQVDEAYLSRWLRCFDEALGASYGALLAQLRASSS
jgi:hypothetical protein